MGLFQGKSSQSGQILLIVVLASVITLTVGLSVASRVITNTKTTTDETNSQKALSAAEAGVEQSLKNGTGQAVSIRFGSNSSQVDTTPQQYSGTQLLVNGGNAVAENDSADIWLSNNPDYSAPLYSGDVRVYWTENDTTANGCTIGSENPNAALEIVVLSGTKTAPTVDHYAYDPCTSRANNFPTPTSTSKTISGIVFDNYITFNVTNGLMARVVPIYGSTSIAIEGYNANSATPKNLPAQGYVIDSTGKAGNATRTLRVFQGFPKLPTEYFPYTLFIPSENE